MGVTNLTEPQAQDPFIMYSVAQYEFKGIDQIRLMQVNLFLHKAQGPASPRAGCAAMMECG